MTRPLPDTKTANLDLNLLVSLDALLAERSVSRAAARLGLSQPTLSAALARLRRHFGDELLTRVGNRYELTPLAAQLADQAPSALAGVVRVFASEADFDPATADREFTVLTSDYAVAILGPALAGLLMAQAPGVRLRLHQLSTRHVDTAAETLRTADAIVMPHGFLADLPSQRLFTDRWVTVVAASNTEVGDQLTMAQLEQLPMIVTYRGPTAYTPADKQLSMLGVRPRVPLVAETFLTVPFLVAATNGFAIIQERLARRLIPAAGVRVTGCPFEAVPLVEALWWHPIHQRDAGHRWLRQLFAEAARQLPELSGSVLFTAGDLAPAESMRRAADAYVRAFNEHTDAADAGVHVTASFAQTASDTS